MLARAASQYFRAWLAELAGQGSIANMANIRTRKPEWVSLSDSLQDTCAKRLQCPSKRFSAARVGGGSGAVCLALPEAKLGIGPNDTRVVYNSPKQ